MFIKGKFDEEGNPFGVNCSNQECQLNQDQKWLVDPLWSEDCPEKNGILVCPRCGCPMVRPKPRQ